MCDETPNLTVTLLANLSKTFTETPLSAGRSELPACAGSEWAIY